MHANQRTTSCKLDNALPNVLNWDIYMLFLRKEIMLLIP